jgi:hypothetical protein
MKRILSLDVAKGFTVLMIAPVHTVMMYSTPQVQHSWLGLILAFIAEGPGAALFMLLMGVGFNFFAHINKTSVCKRAFYFLLAAYSLNVLKFIVPLVFGFLPQNLLQELNLHNKTQAVKFFLLLGDILHFAALAYPVLFFFYRTRNYQYWSLFIAIAMVFLSPWSWDLKTNLIVPDYLLQLVGGHPPKVFFPLFPWLVYPLAGLSIGYYLRQYDTSLVLNRTGICGVAIIIISLLFPFTKPQGDWLPFYRTAPADTLFHLGFVLVWIAVIHWLTQKVPPNPVFRFLAFCSRNITPIYLVQWVLVCWIMGGTGYQTLGFTATFIFICIITITTLTLVRFYGKKNI